MNSLPFSPRLFRVHGSLFWSDEVMLAPQTHSDDRLAAVADLGFDSVWIGAELRQLIPTPLFAPFEGHDSEQRLANLAITADRALRHGLTLWLYLCEPRAYPTDHPFWPAHPECRGHFLQMATHPGWRFGAHNRLPAYGMCLGAEPVREFLYRASRELFTRVPQLGGATVITASEYHTHCYSRCSMTQMMTCPRCVSRQRWEMPVEIGKAMHAGLKESRSSAKLNFWTWAWDSFIEPPPHENVLRHLPREISVTSNFEGGDAVERNGKMIDADEYSFSITGPSRRFTEHVEACRRHGHEPWAKLQVTVTHELATMPSMPLPGCLYDKIAAAKELGVSGTVAIWTMGLRPTLQSFAAGQLLAHRGPLPPRGRWLAALAREYFGPMLDEKSVQQLASAWDAFARAIRHHPMETVFLYFSPTNYAPAYGWKLRREGTRMARTWTPDPWGDKLEMSCKQLTMQDDAELMDRLASEWADALADYRAALSPLVDDNERARQELSVAEATGLFFRSCADCYAFALVAERGDKVEMLRLIERERQTCMRLLPIVEADERIGWHDEPQTRQVDPPRLTAKLQNLVDLKRQIDSR